MSQGQQVIGKDRYLGFVEALHALGIYVEEGESQGGPLPPLSFASFKDLNGNVWLLEEELLGGDGTNDDPFVVKLLVRPRDPNLPK